MDNPLVPELYCSDIKTSLDFYCNALGFRVAYDRPEAKFAFIEREGAELMIEELTEKDRTWLSGPLERPFGRGVNFQIITPEIDALYASLLAKRIPIFLPIEERWYRRVNDSVGNRQFVVQDPDGYLLRFSQTIGTR